MTLTFLRITHLNNEGSIDDEEDISVIKHSSYHTVTDFENIKLAVGHVSGILINKISDHQPIFTCNNKATPLCKESKYIQIETKDERSLSRFLDDLQDADIINNLNQNTLSDPNKNYDTFIEIVVSAKAKHLPTRRVKFNRRKHRIQMWVTKGIIKSINTKDKMYKKLVQSRCDSDLYETLKAHFNKYRNILKKTIAKAKRIYYVDVFNRFKNNIKQTWKVI